MKKLFGLRSWSNSNSSPSSPPSSEKQVLCDIPVTELTNQSCVNVDGDHRSPKRFFSKSKRQLHDSPNPRSNSSLRRSRSLSSSVLFGDLRDQRNLSGTIEQNRSPAHSSSCQHHYHDYPSGRKFAPEKLIDVNQFERTASQQILGLERPGSSTSSFSLQGSTANSSSSNFSSKFLDRHIDGEQQPEKSKLNVNCLHRNFGENGNSSGSLPPRVQYTAPTSPKDTADDKSRSHSFREARGGSRIHLNSRDLAENGYGHESPRRIAKNVIERLSQTRAFTKSQKEFDHGSPITLEDIYGGPLNKGLNSDVDVPARRSFSLDEPYETSSGFHGEDLFCQKQEYCLGNSFRDMSPVQINEENKLLQKSKAAEERVILLSKELEQESFLDDDRFDVPSLIQIIRNLTKDKISLAIEVSNLWKSRITEGESANEELRFLKLELESITQRLEKEKNELQSALEKEIDRRSSDWSVKLQKYQLEEQRLRDRVRELAELNVSLQREVSSLTEKEKENRNAISYSEQQIRQLSGRANEESKEAENLRQNLHELQEKSTAAFGELDHIRRNFEEKDHECKDLQKSVTRLSRTCSEQEKTIEGLREAFEQQRSMDESNKHIGKLQMEHLRLTGVELALRKELESQRLETDSLRQENITLLNRLKGNGKEVDTFTFKLDNEMWSRTCCLQNQGLSMLKESTYLCSKLLEYIKVKAALPSDSKEDLQVFKNGLDRQFLIESDMKLQGLKHGSESLTRSLQTMSSLLQEKSSLVPSESPQTPCSNNNGSGELNNQMLQDDLRYELKAETLLTSLLREKLYSKELEVEQLQAELSAAVRGQEILRCEVQNALDGLSCANHKLKDCELKMLKKDENIIQLQNDLEESMKESTITKGLLPKISQDRDIMWEEVKQYNEKNMLLDSEIKSLKKKIDSLEEDILLKEGQITILKDTLGNRPFTLFDSTDLTNEFLTK